MNNIDFNSLSDTELGAFVLAAITEKDRRKEERRKKEQEKVYWNRVKKAIIEYTERYGDIGIDYGDCYIGSDSDFSEAGAIH